MTKTTLGNSVEKKQEKDKKAKERELKALPPTSATSPVKLQEKLVIPPSQILYETRKNKISAEKNLSLYPITSEAKITSIMHTLHIAHLQRAVKNRKKGLRRIYAPLVQAKILNPEEVESHRYPLLLALSRWLKIESLAPYKFVYVVLKPILRTMEAQEAHFLCIHKPLVATKVLSQQEMDQARHLDVASKEKMFLFLQDTVKKAISTTAANVARLIKTLCYDPLTEKFFYDHIELFYQHAVSTGRLDVCQLLLDSTKDSNQRANLCLSTIAIAVKQGSYNIWRWSLHLQATTNLTPANANAIAMEQLLASFKKEHNHLCVYIYRALRDKICFSANDRDWLSTLKTVGIAQEPSLIITDPESALRVLRQKYLRLLPLLIIPSTDAISEDLALLKGTGPTLVEMVKMSARELFSKKEINDDKGAYEFQAGCCQFLINNCRTPEQMKMAFYIIFDNAFYGGSYAFMEWAIINGNQHLIYSTDTAGRSALQNILLHFQAEYEQSIKSFCEQGLPREKPSDEKDENNVPQTRIIESKKSEEKELVDEMEAKKSLLNLREEYLKIIDLLCQHGANPDGLPPTEQRIWCLLTSNEAPRLPPTPPAVIELITLAKKNSLSLQEQKQLSLEEKREPKQSAKNTEQSLEPPQVTFHHAKNENETPHPLEAAFASLRGHFFLHMENGVTIPAGEPFPQQLRIHAPEPPI